MIYAIDNDRVHYRGVLAAMDVDRVNRLQAEYQEVFARIKNPTYDQQSETMDDAIARLLRMVDQSAARRTKLRRPRTEGEQCRQRFPAARQPDAVNCARSPSPARGR